MLALVTVDEWKSVIRETTVMMIHINTVTHAYLMTRSYCRRAQGFKRELKRCLID